MHMLRKCLGVGGCWMESTDIEECMSAHLEEQPLHKRPVLGMQHALIEAAEAVQHPGLLIICQVLNS